MMLTDRAVTALAAIISLVVSGWAGASFRVSPTSNTEVFGPAAPIHSTAVLATATVPTPVGAIPLPAATTTTATPVLAAPDVTLPVEPQPDGIDDAQCPEMWPVALAAGFTEADLPMLDRIVWNESRCQPDVISPTRDYGWAQINWSAHGHRLAAKGLERDDLLDPYTNMVEALWIADYATEHYGCRWQPWYMSGDWC